jgi:hypothetical protein
MIDEGELKEKNDEKREESPYKCSYLIEHFPTGQNIRAIIIGYMGKSRRFEHLLIGFFVNLPIWK